MLDFLCIGAQKAGTSWLHAQLQQHPRVSFPHGKEVHYWDWVQAGKRPDDIDWYRRKFADQPGKLLGDMTPAYAALEPRYIQQIATNYPQVKVIYILRNPIERAWSAARMAFDFSQLTLEEAGDEWFRIHFNSAASRIKGDYEAVIQRWQEQFDTQLGLYFYDDFRASPRSFLCDVAGWLGLDTDSYQSMPDALLNKRYNRGSNVALSDALYAELLDLYTPKILSLSAFLGKDLNHWLAR